jgi:hypothetical protein
MTDYTDEQLLAMAMANMGQYIHDNSTHYVLMADLRNEKNYDDWQHEMEVLPFDHTWRSTSIDVEVSPSTAD